MTINTIDDFLRVVRENDEVRSAVRRELMTAEVLALPGQFAAMLEEQRNQRQNMTSILEELRDLRQNMTLMQEEQRDQRQNMTSMQEEQRNQRQNMASIFEELRDLRQDTNALLAEQVNMRRDIGALHGMYRRQHDDLARFRGNYALDAAREKYVSIARLFAQRNGLRRIYVRSLADSERRDLLVRNTDALESLDLRDAAWDSFMSPDLVAEITGLHVNEEPRYYIAVEASFTADRNDLERATDNAKILRCATGRDAYAVVAAVRLAPSIENLLLADVTEYVEADNEDVALWYALAEEELEPPDPC